jgi:TetR/AcrR family transcriptional repressor of mexJK operon
MPRIAGQIDLAKTEAILEATAQAIFERGAGVSVDEIARRAGVSKQTVYNHYGSKSDLVRALIQRRTDMITAPLDVPPGRPEEALAAYARLLLETIALPRGLTIFRILIASVGSDPEVAQAAFRGGVGVSRAKLAEFLARENGAGRLSVPDPGEAAEFFSGMVVSQRQMSGLMGLPMDLTPERIERLATEAARRFIRAYAPVSAS